MIINQMAAMTVCKIGNVGAKGYGEKAYVNFSSGYGAGGYYMMGARISWEEHNHHCIEISCVDWARSDRRASKHCWSVG